MSYVQEVPFGPPLSDRLAVLRLRADLAACAAGPLSAALGSTLHGAIGRALKRTACVFPRPEEQPCAGCAMLSTCGYPALFEPRRLQQQGGDPAPALVLGIEPRALPQVQAGGVLGLELALIGAAVQALPLCLAALSAMVEEGLGPARLPFTMLRVDVLDAAGAALLPLQVGARILNSTAPPLRLPDWLNRADRQPAVERLTLQLRAPLALKRGGQIEAGQPRFTEIARALVRRAALLAQEHGHEEAAFPDPRPWLAAADTVQVSTERLHWEERLRQSASTGMRMPVSGAIGSVTYTGEPAVLRAFLPLLFLGEAISIGRGCSFGNGRYRVSLSPGTGAAP